MKVKDSGKLDLLKGSGTGYRTKQSIDKANKQLAHFVELLKSTKSLKSICLEKPILSIGHNHSAEEHSECF